MTAADAGTTPFAGRTAWARNLETPLREYLRTETGGAAVLLGFALAALVWTNVDADSYNRVWSTVLSIDLGGHAIALDLRGWVNSGLMTFFFLVVGLEARREFDLGELRERRRFALPLAAGLGGMVVAIAIYLAFNAGGPSAHGWGIAMSTDTAFALGMLALVGPRFPGRLRAFMLTVVVVDDVLALGVIGDRVQLRTSRSRGCSLRSASSPSSSSSGLCHLRGAFICWPLAAAIWVALLESGVDPVVVGLAMGLTTYAYPAARADLERATQRFREFREQPTPELARSVDEGVRAAISPNERLQHRLHPWTSYAIVPLFALANAGIELDGGVLRRAVTSPITLGVFFGYVVGKPLGILGGSWLVTRGSGGRLRPPVGWASVAGAGTIAGIGFTVSLLIATLAFSGDELDEAKLGILGAAIGASVVTWLLFRATALLPKGLKVRALLGATEPLVDLAVEVTDERDHLRGSLDAPVTVVEYGDFECPYCGQAEPVVRELLRDYGDVRYVWRHLPLNDVHPHAQLAAEAAEAADEQGAFWEMHDLLLDHQGDLTPRAIAGYAAELGLDTERFMGSLREHTGAARVADDVDSADLSGVTGTPTFFVNGRRHYGAYDIESLAAAVRAAGARAAVAAT